MRRHTVTNWFYLCSRAVHCTTTDAVLALPEYKPSVVWMICKNILLIAGHLKTQVMCLNVRVVNQLWKSCAIRNLHLWPRYNNARLHQDEPLKSGRSREGKNLGVWITRGAGLPELTRVTLPEQAPGCPDTSVVALPCNNQCACSSSENSNMPPSGQRYTPLTVSLTVHTQFCSVLIFSRLSLYWSKAQISSLESQATEFLTD